MIHTQRFWAKHGFSVTGIPYMRNPSDQLSHDYVDLRLHPELIDTLPELSDWPAMKSVMVGLNHADGSLRSIACAQWYHDMEPEVGLEAYVQFCFVEGEAFTTPNALYAMFHHFSPVAQERGIHDVLSGEFEISRVGFNDSGQEGWSATYWLRDRGKVRQELKNRASKALEVFNEFLFK